MGKCFKYLVIVCASIMSFACTNLDDDLSVVTPEGAEITITASREDFEPNTRTIRESDGSVEWCPLDEISVFYSNGTSGGSKFTSQNTEQTAIAEFRGRLEGISAGGEDFTNGKYLYGVYPYSLDTKFNDGIVTISLPSHQSAADGTFANGLFPTIARAQGVNLAFYNICGGIKFTVSRNDITSVSFKGNNGERIAGTANVTFNSSEIPIVLDEEIESKNEIIVYAPAGGTFEVGKEYFIVAYPTNLSSGFTMTFRTSDMKEGVYVHNNAVEIKRSIFGVLNQKDKDITSWTDATVIGGGNNSGIYLGVMGFNQQLYSYPLSELNDESKSGFDSFITDLPMKNGTLLYYSVDQAIAALQTASIPENLQNVAIVTFSDGLDQGSMMLNSNYLTDEEYLEALQNKINTSNVQNISLSAYSIGVRGSDVSDINKFQQNLQFLASTPDNAFEVSDMTQVNAKFQDIASELTKTSFTQSLALTMPGPSHGTIVRFTLDNIVSADKSQLYIEGTFNLQQRRLENVKYYGLSSTSGEIVEGEVVNGIMVKFKFDGLVTDNGEVIQPNAINQWTYINSSSSWQINSEFEREDDIDITTIRNSALIMLILDCSSSLGSDFEYLKSAAKSFVATLCMATPPVENPDITYDYSTTPFDLALAVQKEDVLYYLTPYDYNRAGGVPDGYSALGVVILDKNVNFYVSRYDHSYGEVSYKSSEYTILDNAPTLEIATTIVSRFDDIQAGMNLYGGNQLSGQYWIKERDYHFSNNKCDYYYFDSSGIHYHTTSGYEGDMQFYKYVRRVREIK